ncbi:MAG: hypothetical protein ACXWLM_11780 [Myxococcales bacterium]
MRGVVAAAVLALCACAHEPRRPSELDGWRSGHPGAASELCTFARNSPTDATRLRQWARSHPAQAAQLLDLAAENGAWQTSAFLGTQRDWQGYTPARDPAFYDLMDWAYHRPEAAHDLAAAPRGLERAMEGRSCQAATPQ